MGYRGALSIGAVSDEAARLHLANGGQGCGSHKENQNCHGLDSSNKLASFHFRTSALEVAETDFRFSKRLRHLLSSALKVVPNVKECQGQIMKSLPFLASHWGTLI